VRTAFFVDGYNLYYGVLHGSDHKWLDLTALLAEILRIQEPSAELVSVDYFTSPVIARLATRGQVSNDAQNRYIRALPGERRLSHARYAPAGQGLCAQVPRWSEAFQERSGSDLAARRERDGR